MLDYENALAILLAQLSPVSCETLDLASLLGRISSKDLCAVRALPPYAHSSMDGYALRANESAQELKLFGEMKAGSLEDIEVPPGYAARIFTGAPLPTGCDSVLMQEYATVEGLKLRSQRDVVVGESVRALGCDMLPGDPLIRAGACFGPGDMAGLAAQGILSAMVYRRPRVALIATGDELIEPGPMPRFGQTTNATAPMVLAQLSSFGCDGVFLSQVDDSYESLMRTLREQAQNFDMLLITGGMSVGDHDYAALALRDLGQVAFHKVAMKPGKPVAFAKIGTTPVLGLPGNPGATFVALEVLGRPALRKLAGAQVLQRPTHRLKLAHTISPNRRRIEFLRGQIAGDVFIPHPKQLSSQFSSLLGVEALAMLPTGDSDLIEGTQVKVLDLR